MEGFRFSVEILNVRLDRREANGNLTSTAV